MVRTAARFFAACLALACAGRLSGSAQSGGAPLTVDDLMRLRAIVDVQISPDGSQVAYVTSTPNLARNAHAGALFVAPAGGGPSTRLAESLPIFNVPTPRPQLRWTPDGRSVSVLGLAEGRPEVFLVSVPGGEARQTTYAPEGVVAYEWSPDGGSLACLTLDPMPAEEQRRRADKSFVIRAGAPERAVRLVVQRADRPEALRILTPPSQYVDALSWSPDGREIAYSAAPRSGFSAAYEARVYAVAIESGAVRTIVDRAGMNT